MLLSLVLSFALESHSTVPVGKEIRWTKSLSGALEQAAEEERVVFVALTIDGEARAERFARDTYFEREVIAQSERTINVIGSPNEHRNKGACKMFQEIECIDHQRADAEIREELVARNDLGLAALPQHLWLNSSGEVLLSVPFEMTAEEMVWCFAFADWKRNPETTLQIPSGARAPRRVVFGKAYRLGDGSDPGRGLTEKELAEGLDVLEGSTWTEDRVALWLRVVFTDDEKAVSNIRTGLGSALLTWSGDDRLNGAIDVIGEWSPVSYAPVITDFMDHPNPAVRMRAAVALEQLGASSVVRDIEKALSKEKDEEVLDNWIRALGSCGFESTSVRKRLIKIAESNQNASLRINAILALGWSSSDETVARFLRAIMRSEDEKEAEAAICAVTMARKSMWIPEMEGIMEHGATEDLRKLAERAKQILEGRSLASFEANVRMLSGDTFRRGRIFFGER